MKKLTPYVVVGALGFLPLVASAQVSDLNTLLQFLSRVIGALLPLIIGLAVLLFLWGLIKYIGAQGDAEAQATARSFMVWGIVIIFVMVSVWGLINFLDTTFGLDKSTQIPPPVVPTVPTI